ncbi:MAG: type I restriction-modification enzyme R subunit C-terminal domain-containing protein [Bosea sp. (in: a-proteobacteria)]
MIRLADGKDRSIQYIAATTYWGPDGQPMTAQQFLERLDGDLSSLIMDEDALRKAWSAPESREHFLSVLEQRGYDPEKLDEMRRLIDAPDSDLFDVLAYIRFSTPPKTRSARAANAKDDLESQHEQMQAVSVLGAGVMSSPSAV